MKTKIKNGKTIINDDIVVEPLPTKIESVSGLKRWFLKNSLYPEFWIREKRFALKDTFDDNSVEGICTSDDSCTRVYALIEHITFTGTALDDSGNIHYISVINAGNILHEDSLSI